MKLNKIFLFATIALSAMLASCGDDDDDYQKGGPAGAYDVFFIDEENVVLGPDDTEFTVKIARANSNGELTVPLTARCVDVFNVPSSVTFPNGVDEVEFTVTVNDNVEWFKNYPFVITLPDNYINPYVEDAGTPRYNISVVKEDYKLFAVATFSDPVYYKNAWRQPIEYSELLGVYRMADCFTKGTPWYFKWPNRTWNSEMEGEKGFYFCDETGKEVTSWLTGIVHSRYGAISAEFIPDYWYGWDPDEEGLFFVLDINVSAGSFGVNYFSLTDFQYAE